MANNDKDVPLVVLDSHVSSDADGTRSLSIADEQRNIQKSIQSSASTKSIAEGHASNSPSSSEDKEMVVPSSFPAFAPSAPVRAADFLGNGRWRKEPLAIVLATCVFVIVFAIFKYGLADHFHNCWDECAQYCTAYGDTFYRYSFVLTLYGSVGILPRVFGLWRSIIYRPKRQQHFAGLPMNETPVVDSSPGYWQTLVFAICQVVVTFFVNAGLKEGHTISFPLGLIGLPAFFSLLFGGWEGLKRYTPYLVFGLLISVLTSVIMWLFPTLRVAFGESGFDVSLALLPISLTVVEFLFLGIVGKMETQLNYWSDEQLVWLAALLLIGIQSVSIGMLLNIRSGGLVALNIILDAVLDVCDRLDIFHRVLYTFCFKTHHRPDIPRLESIYSGCKVLFDLVPVAAYVLMAAFNYSPSGGSEQYESPPLCTSTPLLSKYQLSTTWPIIIGILFSQTVADICVFYGGHYLFQKERLRVIETEIENERKANSQEGQQEKAHMLELVGQQEVLDRQVSQMKKDKVAGADLEAAEAKLKEANRKLKDAAKAASSPPASPKQIEKPELIRRASDIVKGKSNYRFGGEGRVVEFASFGNLFLLMISSFFFALLGLDGAGIVLNLIAKEEVIP